MVTDVLSAFSAVYLLWEQYLIIGVCAAFIPSTVISMILIAKVDLEKYKNSAFGVYIRNHMSSTALDWLRFAGLMVMMIGGWNRWIWLIALGFCIVLYVWLKGLIPRKSSHTEK